MKENKNAQIKVRVTTAEKEKIDAYCEKYDITVSEMIRKAVNRLLSREEK